MGAKGHANRSLLGKTEGKRLLGRHRHRREVFIKVDVREI
jgi:hypothetical protein